jgi:hypothetical protein
MRGSWRVPLAGHWVGTMRCMACGAEMILVKVIADETMPVPVFSATPTCVRCATTPNDALSSRPLGTTDRPVQQQSRTRNCGPAVPRVHAGLDFYGGALGPAVNALARGRAMLRRAGRDRVVG